MRLLLFVIIFVIAEIAQHPIISIHESQCIKFTENWTANDHSNFELYLLLRHLEKIIKSVFKSVQKSASVIINKSLDYKFGMNISVFTAYLKAWSFTWPGSWNSPVHIFRHISNMTRNGKGFFDGPLEKLENWRHPYVIIHLQHCFIIRHTRTDHFVSHFVVCWSYSLLTS